MKTNSPRLSFFCAENPMSGSSSTIEHISADGQSVLCKAKAKGQVRDAADWEALHTSRFHRRCPKCQQAAILLLRPEAKYWYADPLHADIKEFGSLPTARKTAKTEHGTSTIWQTGPGETHKIVEFVHGLESLP